MSNKFQQKLFDDPWYTVRRYYVDRFFTQAIDRFSSGSRILDMGGHRSGKRGLFNIEEHELKVEYANIDPETEPDYLGDAAHLPVDGSVFDGVILGEVLEHISNPVEMLQEAFRLLKPGGCMLVTTPFMFHLHADPYDYCRYTNNWYEKYLSEIGYTNIEIEKQGGFFAVMTNMLRMWRYSLNTKGMPQNKFKWATLNLIANKFSKNFEKWDQRDFYANHKIFSGHTTGFGVTCYKPR